MEELNDNRHIQPSFYFIGDIHADIFVLIKLLINITNYDINDNDNSGASYIMKYCYKANSIEQKININLNMLIYYLDNIVNKFVNLLNNSDKYIILLGDVFDMNYNSDTIKNLSNCYNRSNLCYMTLNGAKYKYNEQHIYRFWENVRNLYPKYNEQKFNNILTYMHDLSFITFLFIVMLKEKYKNLIYVLGNHERYNNYDNSYLYLHSANYRNNDLHIDENDMNHTFEVLFSRDNYIFWPDMSPFKLYNKRDEHGLIEFIHIKYNNNQLNKELYLSHAGILILNNKNNDDFEYVYADTLINILENIIHNDTINFNNTYYNINYILNNNNSIINICLPNQIIGHTATYNYQLNNNNNNTDIMKNMSKLLEYAFRQYIILLSDNLKTIYSNDEDRFNIYYYELLYDGTLNKKREYLPNSRINIQPINNDNRVCINTNTNELSSINGGKIITKNYNININKNINKNINQDDKLKNIIKNIKSFVNNNIKFIYLLSIINYDFFIYLLAYIVLDPNVTNKLLNKNTQTLIKLYLKLYPTSVKELHGNDNKKQYYNKLIECFNNENYTLFKDDGSINLNTFVELIICINNININDNDKQTINKAINYINNIDNNELLKIFDN